MQRGLANAVDTCIDNGPDYFCGAKVFQKALFDAGIHHIAFQSDNLEQAYEKLVSLV